ncbi:hypothetical protein [Labrys miyagiensis]|uniref:hypothetical protein n=1 Tax=Labrys miyagiensis TaxID=346912 RepID=UPI0024E0BC5D|nr:hypothetical protein [Labrys miyagiensis]
MADAYGRRSSMAATMREFPIAKMFSDPSRAENASVSYSVLRFEGIGKNRKDALKQGVRAMGVCV